MTKIKMTKERYNEINDMAVISTGHWQDVVAGKLHYRTTIDCPACKKYLFQDNACNGCYIVEQTSGAMCVNTPINAYSDLFWHYKINNNWELTVELKVAAQDCLDFLIKLRKTLLAERFREFILECKPVHKHGSANEFTPPLSGDMN